MQISSSQDQIKQEPEVNIFCPDIDAHTLLQIKRLTEQPAFQNAKIVIMPDAHPGYVVPIGFTAIVPRENPIMPMSIGTDIGCGISVRKVDIKRKNWDKLDTVIREHVPSGSNIHIDSSHIKNINEISDLYDKINSILPISKDTFYNSLGTLGSGNHFIEIDKDDEENYYIVVHSGSRSIGKTVHEYFMKKAFNKYSKTPYELSALRSRYHIWAYTRAVGALVEYATLNRLNIIESICNYMKWDIIDDISIDIPHNFYEFYDENNIIIRKGAIAANNNPVAIPINSRDGVIIGIGNASVIRNLSLPHGSGRLYSRSESKHVTTLSQYKKDLIGVHSPSINKSTLDESPAIYRPIDYILSNTSTSIRYAKILKPVYNFKPGGK